MTEIAIDASPQRKTSDGGSSDVSSDDDDGGDGAGVLMTHALTSASNYPRSSARDSDFGFSEQQLSDLLNQCEKGPIRRKMTMEDVAVDDSDHDSYDSDFGLSDHQLEELQKLHPRLEQEADDILAELAAQLSTLQREPSEAVMPAVVQIDVAVTSAVPVASAVTPPAATGYEATAVPLTTANADSATSTTATQAVVQSGGAVASTAPAPSTADKRPSNCVSDGAASAGYTTSAVPVCAASATPVPNMPAEASLKDQKPVLPKGMLRREGVTADSETLDVQQVPSLGLFLGEKTPNKGADEPLSSLGDFLGEKTPPNSGRAGANWNAMVLSSRIVDNHCWYLLKVEVAKEERFYMKQYRDFSRLDRGLRREYAQALQFQQQQQQQQEQQDQEQHAVATMPAGDVAAAQPTGPRPFAAVGMAFRRISGKVIDQTAHAVNKMKAGPAGAAASVDPLSPSALEPPPELPSETKVGKLLGVMGGLLGGKAGERLEDQEERIESSHGSSQEKGQVLQLYLKKLQKQIHELDERPALRAFFCNDSPNRVVPKTTIPAIVAQSFNVEGYDAAKKHVNFA